MKKTYAKVALWLKVYNLYTAGILNLGSTIRMRLDINEYKTMYDYFYYTCSMKNKRPVSIPVMEYAYWNWKAGIIYAKSFEVVVTVTSLWCHTLGQLKLLHMAFLDLQLVYFTNLTFNPNISWVLNGHPWNHLNTQGRMSKQVSRNKALFHTETLFHTDNANWLLVL